MTQPCSSVISCSLKYIIGSIHRFVSEGVVLCPNDVLGLMRTYLVCFLSLLIFLAKHILVAVDYSTLYGVQLPFMSTGGAAVSLDNTSRARVQSRRSVVNTSITSTPQPPLYRCSPVLSSLHETHSLVSYSPGVI